MKTRPGRGNLTLRIRDETREKLQKVAEQAGYSLSEAVERMIESRLNPDPILTPEQRRLMIALLAGYEAGTVKMPSGPTFGQRLSAHTDIFGDA